MGPMKNKKNNKLVYALFLLRGAAKRVYTSLGDSRNYCKKKKTRKKKKQQFRESSWSESISNINLCTFPQSAQFISSTSSPLLYKKSNLAVFPFPLQVVISSANKQLSLPGSDQSSIRIINPWMNHANGASAALQFCQMGAWGRVQGPAGDKPADWPPNPQI